MNIADEVYRLHRRLWRARHDIYPMGCHPLNLLKPQLATSLLGYEYVERPIGDWPQGQRTKTAGLVDPQQKQIVISDEFDTPIMRFTAAHEIGHIVLHKLRTLHRDRPIKGPRPNQQSYKEREADIFASLFLMPEKLVREALDQIWGIKSPIQIDDNLAFHLTENTDEILYTEPGSLLPLRRLSSCSPMGSNRVPLNKRFGVSVTAMAIRLQELGVIRT